MKKVKEAEVEVRDILPSEPVEAPEYSEEFKAFVRFTQKIVRVPKAEVDAKRKGKTSDNKERKPDG